jgi:hypothetical protein
MATLRAPKVSNHLLGSTLLDRPGSCALGSSTDFALCCCEDVGLLLTTECVVVERKEEKPAPMGGPPGGGMGGMY